MGDLFAGSIQGWSEICLVRRIKEHLTGQTEVSSSPACRSSLAAPAAALPPCCSHWAPWLPATKSWGANFHHWQKSQLSSRSKFIFPASSVPPYLNLWRILIIHKNYMSLLRFRSQWSPQEVENTLFSRYRKEVIKGQSVVVSGK